MDLIKQVKNIIKPLSLAVLQSIFSSQVDKGLDYRCRTRCINGRCWKQLMGILINIKLHDILLKPPVHQYTKLFNYL